MSSINKEKIKETKHCAFTKSVVICPLVVLIWKLHLMFRKINLIWNKVKTTYINILKSKMLIMHINVKYSCVNILWNNLSPKINIFCRMAQSFKHLFFYTSIFFSLSFLYFFIIIISSMQQRLLFSFRLRSSSFLFFSAFNLSIFTFNFFGIIFSIIFSIFQRGIRDAHRDIGLKEAAHRSIKFCICKV